MDMFYRKVLNWKLSYIVDTEFCLDAWRGPLAGDRKPDLPFQPELPTHLFCHRGKAKGREEQDERVRKKTLLRQYPGGEVMADTQIIRGISTCP